MNFFTRKFDIIDWLEKHGVNHYEVHDDLSVDVNGTVDLNFKNIGYLPVQFGVVTGSFLCNESKLKSLKGSPRTVGENFYFWSNPLLTTLEGAPQSVGRSINFSYTKITSLEHCPILGENLLCFHNQLVSLKGCPKVIPGDFNCSTNQLENLKNGPIEVGKNYHCEHNQLTSLLGVAKTIGLNLNCSSNQLSELKATIRNVREVTAHNNDIVSIEELYLDAESYLHLCNKNDHKLPGFEEYYAQDSSFYMSYHDIHAKHLSEKLEHTLNSKNSESKKVKL